MNIKINKDYNFKNKIIEIKKTKANKSQTLSIQTINAILETLKLDKIKSINEYFKNVFNSLNRQNVDWVRFLPVIQKSNYSRYLKKEIALQ